MSEVHFDIIASDIRCHSNDWRRAELSYQVACGDTIEVWHNDVHKHEIVLCAGLYFVDSFQAVELEVVSPAYSSDPRSVLTAESIEQLKA